jgi:hypothetical protein
MVWYHIAIEHSHCNRRCAYAHTMWHLELSMFEVYTMPTSMQMQQTTYEPTPISHATLNVQVDENQARGHGFQLHWRVARVLQNAVPQVMYTSPALR